jgi:peptidoglycan hydrolase CwlO-like protein
MILAESTKGVIALLADNWLSVLIAVIVAVFGGGGVAALIRTRSEGPKILVDAAAGAVVVQSGVIESLKDDLHDARAEIAELRAHMAEINGLRSRVRELEHRNDVLEAENTELKSEIETLKKRFNTNGFH